MGEKEATGETERWRKGREQKKGEDGREGYRMKKGKGEREEECVTGQREEMSEEN